MAGFELEHNSQVIEKAVKERYQTARQEVLMALQSPGYEEIIQAVRISQDFSDIEIKLKDGVEVNGQDIVQVFAKGGQIIKNDEMINIYPSPIIRKYLGTQ